MAAPVSPSSSQSVPQLSAGEKLQQLRQLMSKHNLDAYIVPSEDAHSSEYIAEAHKRRHYISGFTGSAGFAVIGKTAAAVWTDGRYFLQASRELDAEHWTLMRSGEAGVPTAAQWLRGLCGGSGGGGRVGVDATLLSKADADAYRGQLAGAAELVAVDDGNLVDAVWAAARPAEPSAEAVAHAERYSGCETAEKLQKLRASLTAAGAHAMLVPSLDENCWLFNIRGGDVPCNPVVVCYGFVSTTGDAVLFVEPRKVQGEEVQRHLAAGGVTVRPYADALPFLRQWLQQHADATLLLDPSSCSMAIEMAAAGHRHVRYQASPIELAKALKNPVELAGMRECHRRDAVALIRFFAWLEAELARPGAPAYDEVDVASRLESFRSDEADFVSISFETIAGTGANGAIIHYHPQKPTAAVVRRDAMFLCDSGGQYRDGTTDVTRTLHFGTPTDFERRAYTRVLQGHIRLARQRFPAGTSGAKLDMLARSALWDDFLDYRHGTGHGVGSFLNVHEGPQGIGTRASCGIEASMTMTNEPGYYHEGHFGIRIESQMIARPESAAAAGFGGATYLGWETITLVPMAQNLIDLALLSDHELAWLNAYHDSVRTAIAPRLEAHPAALAWLLRETRPMERR